MNSSHDETTMRHEQVFELLPWYVNETLNDAETLLVEEHLRACVTCQAEVTELSRLASDLGSLGMEDMLEQSLATVNRRIDQEERRTQSVPPVRQGQWWRGLKQWWDDAPLTAQGLFGAQAAAIAALLLWISLDDTNSQGQVFETLSDPVVETSGPMVRIKVDDNVTELALRELLLSEELSIANGPTPTGVYTLVYRGEESGLSDLTERLTASTLVAFATIVAQES